MKNWKYFFYSKRGNMLKNVTSKLFGLKIDKSEVKLVRHEKKRKIVKYFFFQKI